MKTDFHILKLILKLHLTLFAGFHLGNYSLQNSDIITECLDVRHHSQLVRPNLKEKVGDTSSQGRL